MKPCGVDPGLLAELVGILSKEPKVQKVFLFGSRARGDFRAGSDIDLAVSAPDLTFQEYLSLRGALDDDNLPVAFKTDLVHIESLAPESRLAARIARDGVSLYQAPAQAA